MRILLKEFNKFRRAGFLKNGTVLTILLIIPSLAVSVINLLYKGSISPVLSTVILFCDLLIACLVPLTVTNLFSMNRYILFNTLPIKSINIIKMLYIETFSVICISYILTGVFNWIQYGLYFLVIQILKMGISLSISNMFLPMMSSGELKEPSDTKTSVIVTIMVCWVMVVTMIFTAAILIDSQLVLDILYSYNAKITVSVLAVLTTSVAAVTVKKSFNKTTKKVRLIW